MKHLFLSCLTAIAVFLAPRATAAPPPEPATVLDPIVVTGIRPLIKIAEHPMLEPRFGAAIVAEGDYLYIIGGSNSEGTRLDTVERVDLRTGKAALWTKLQVARRHHRAVVTGGKIYVLGGTSGPVNPSDPLSEELSDYSGDHVPIGEQLPRSWFDPPENPLKPPTAGLPKIPYDHERTMEIIDLQTGKVTTGPAMPFAKTMFGCVVVDGRILVIGGQKRRSTDHIVCTNTTEIFDPVSNQWSAGINMPTARRCTATLVDGYVIVLGGYEGRQASRRVEVFTPRDKVWHRLTDLKESANPSATVWCGNYLFLFGDQAARSRQLVYDLRSKQLVPYPLAMPNSDFAAALWHEGKIYVVGGASLRLHDTSEGYQVFAPTLDIAVPPGRPDRLASNRCPASNVP